MYLSAKIGLKCMNNGSKKVINRSLLIKAAEVLELINNADNDSATMDEMRQRVFERLPREHMDEVRQYFNSPSEYTINEDIGTK